MLCFFCACTSENPYLIAKNKVGNLTNATKIYQLQSIFKNDSIVPVLSEGFLENKAQYELQGADNYQIYEKSSGKHLLTITAENPSDSLSNILSVAIFDQRYKTQEGIGLDINFEQLSAKTYIRKIETSFNYVTLYLDAIGATMTLSKKDLKLSVFDMRAVQKQQIPALAKPQSFILWFERDNEQ